MVVPVIARQAIEYTITEWEDGYVNNPADKGGETNFGISKRSYPSLDIKNITQEKAIEIYYKDFWKPIKADEIKSALVAAKLFDMAVNMGASQAVKILQRAYNIISRSDLIVDGVIGNRTLAAINGVEELSLLSSLAAENVLFYKGLIDKDPSQNVFKEGWFRRAVHVIPTTEFINKELVTMSKIEKVKVNQNKELESGY
jgi:lysozyme family protein